MEDEKWEQFQTLKNRRYCGIIFKFYKEFLEHLNGIKKYEYSSNGKSRLKLGTINFKREKIVSVNEVKWQDEKNSSNVLVEEEYAICYGFIKMQKLALEVNETQYFYKYAEEVSIASFLFDFVAEVLFKVCLLDKKIQVRNLFYLNF